MWFTAERPPSRLPSGGVLAKSLIARSRIMFSFRDHAQCKEPLGVKDLEHVLKKSGDFFTDMLQHTPGISIGDGRDFGGASTLPPAPSMVHQRA
jgi:hypothetical protein